MQEARWESVWGVLGTGLTPGEEDCSCQELPRTLQDAPGLEPCGRCSEQGKAEPQPVSGCWLSPENTVTLEVAEVYHH